MPMERKIRKGGNLSIFWKKSNPNSRWVRVSGREERLPLYHSKVRWVRLGGKEWIILVRETKWRWVIEEWKEVNDTLLIPTLIFVNFGNWKKNRKRRNGIKVRIGELKLDQRNHSNQNVVNWKEGENN